MVRQQPISADEAAAAASMLDLGDDVRLALQLQPSRGALENAVPVDPTVYRFYEIVQVYGPTIKAGGRAHHRYHPSEWVTPRAGPGGATAAERTPDIASPMPCHPPCER
jgi:hypothetical protein